MEQNFEYGLLDCDEDPSARTLRSRIAECLEEMKSNNFVELEDVCVLEEKSFWAAFADMPVRRHTHLLNLCRIPPDGEQIDLTQMSKLTIARRNSINCSGSTLWMSSLGDDFDMPDHLFRIALMMHTDTPVFKFNPIRGSDGTRLNYKANFVDHALSSKSLNGLNIARHNTIAKTLAYFCRKAGAVVSIEERTCFEDQTRVDVTAVFPRKTLHYDTSVGHPGCQSHVVRAQTPGGVALARGISKIKKHGHMTDHSNLFSPFVMESYGRFGPYATDTIKFLAQAILANDGLPGCRRNYSAIMYEIRRRFSLSLQKANAALISEAMKRAIKKSKGAFSQSSVLRESEYYVDDLLARQPSSASTGLAA
jgi:hypothetical protein